MQVEIHINKIILLTLFFCLIICSNIKIHAQDNLFTKDHSDSTIRATVSNYTPKINKPVKIHISYKHSAKRFPGPYSLLFNLDENMEIIEGEKKLNISSKIDKLYEWDVLVKFAKAKVYDVKIALAKEYFLQVSFYVDGAYRESLENKDLRNAIINYKKYVKEIDIDSSECLVMGYNGNDFNEIKKQHKLELINGYDSLNTQKANSWNRNHFLELKKEYKVLMDIHRSKYQLPTSSPFYRMLIEKENKKEVISRNKNVGFIAPIERPVFRRELIDTTLEIFPVDSLHDNRFIMKKLYGL